ncbi:MAG TPA: hypothetical protein VEF34_13045 [Syntrophobacteraceae bacterium]|nr:hypothetical protein [Syntrophobacteraceae bacterium]
MKSKTAVLAILILFLKYSSPVFVEAATARANVTLHVTIEPVSQLTLNGNSNDDRNSRIGALNDGVGAIANVRPGSTPAILTVTARDDLMKGVDIDALSVAGATVTDANGHLFLDAPAAPGETDPADVAGTGCTASYSETFNWYLKKNWNCDTGKQTVTIIYTLASP